MYSSPDGGIGICLWNFSNIFLRGHSARLANPGDPLANHLRGASPGTLRASLTPEGMGRGSVGIGRPKPGAEGDRD